MGEGYGIGNIENGVWGNLHEERGTVEEMEILDFFFLLSGG